MNNPHELTVLEDFTNILDRLRIPYAIGGSMASSIYGKVRFTQDADITVEPFDNQAEQLSELLKPEYYVSDEAMYQALKEQKYECVQHTVSTQTEPSGHGTTVPLIQQTSTS